MWNPGDEVIYRGVRNVVTEILGPHSSILWNRNPGVKPFNQGFDNSLDPCRHLLKNIRLLVSAGGPEWLGPRVAGVYRRVVAEKLDCVHMGIGLGAHQISMTPLELEVLGERSRFVSCRDTRTYDVLKDIVPDDRLSVLPCPSLFSYIHDYKIHESESVKKVGINFQSSKMKFNNVSGSAFESCLRTYLEICKKYETTIICNYIDDYAEAVQIFDPESVRFSADSEDFLHFFREVDLVIGTRIHGCMGAIASGTPAMIMDSENDARRRGVREVMEVLPAAPSNDSELYELIDEFSPRKVSEKNREYQLGQFKVLVDSLNSKLPDLPEILATYATPSSCAVDWEDAVGRMESGSVLPSRGLSEKLVGGATRIAQLIEKVERRWL